MAALAALLASLSVALALTGRSGQLSPFRHSASTTRAIGRPPETGLGLVAGGPGGRRWRLMAAAGAGSAVLVLAPGALALPGAVAGAVLVWWRSAAWESASLRRRRQLLEAQLPHVVDLMAAALAAGAAPAAALARVADVVEAPMGDELRGYTSRLALGADPVSVWRSLAEHPQLGRLGVALLRSAESGAQVSGALARLADELRSRGRAAVEARVRQVEVKAAVPLGVCLLPAFVLLGVVPLVVGSALNVVVAR